MKKALVALETATDVCGVAIHDGHRVVVSSVLRQRQMHARALVPLVAEAVSWLPGGWDSVGAVAVSGGPGSYTGLRIGVSAAKGLCAARDLALVAVPSLDALAAQVLPFLAPGGVVGAAFNSRRGEVYVAWYEKRGEELACLEAPAARLLDAATLGAPEAEHRWLMGEGAPLLAPLLARPATVFPDTFAPDPAWVARLGYDRWQRGETEDVAEFEPDYLKPFIAREPAAPP